MLSNDEVIQQIHHILVYTDFPDRGVYLLGNILSKTAAEFYGRVENVPFLYPPLYLLLLN